MMTILGLFAFKGAFFMPYLQELSKLPVTQLRPAQLRESTR